MKHPKFVQILCMHGGEGYNWHLCALDENGEVWRWDDSTREWRVMA